MDSKTLLIFLNNLPPATRRKIIDQLQKKQIEGAISHIFSSLLKKKIPIHVSTLKKLKPYKKIIKLLATGKTSASKKKQILKSQRGGSLLALLLPLAVTAIHKLFA